MHVLHEGVHSYFVKLKMDQVLESLSFVQVE